MPIGTYVSIITFNVNGLNAPTRTDHILGHKSSLSKFKKIEIVSSIFSDHNAMRLDINHRKKTAKKHKLMEVKQYITK